MKKKLTTVDANGEAEKYLVSNQDEFLSHFENLVLRDEEGYRVGGYESLEHGHTYTVTAKNYPPPRGGIGRAPFTLRREELVSRILVLASGTSGTAILRSPPATGKTTLLDLTEERLLVSAEARVVRINIDERVDDEGLIGNLTRKLHILDCHKIESLSGDTWILIDDAQLASEAESFWKIIMKDYSRYTAVHVVIATTYDLVGGVRAPFSFGEHHHVPDLLLTPAETEELYDGHVNKLSYTKGWVDFKEILLTLSGGHAGVLVNGIAMLHRIKNEEQKSLTEPEALGALRCPRFREDLNGCFPYKDLMNDKQAVIERIIRGHCSSYYIDASEGTNYDETLVQLVRAGILTCTGAYSCPAAQWFLESCNKSSNTY